MTEFSLARRLHFVNLFDPTAGTFDFFQEMHKFIRKTARVPVHPSHCTESFDMRHSLPRAYSHSLDREVTVEEIEQSFSASDEFDPRAFHCLGENCLAQVTLAGWFTPKIERKKQLHFRSFHHVEGCLYLSFLKAKKDQEPTEKTPILPDPDTFEPASDREFPPTSPPPTLQVADAANVQYGEFRRPEDQPKTFGYLEDFVRRYRRLSTAGELTGRLVRIGDKLFEYEDVFQEIDRQDAKDHLRLPRVWYGPATIRKVKTGYQVRFEKVLQWGREAIRPAFLIPESWVTFYPEYPKRILDLFREADRGTAHAVVYAKGDVKTTTKDETVYLNIKAYRRSEFWMEPLRG